MDYLKLLEDGEAFQNRDDGARPGDRLRYLSDYIFDFFVDSDEMKVLFATKALEVCAAIKGGFVENYISNPDNRRWFLSLANTPFFLFKFYWTTDITEARWDGTQEGIQLETIGMCEHEDASWISTITFTVEEWEKFIDAMIEFVNNEPK